MTDIARLEIDESPLVASVNRASKSLTDLLRMVQQLSSGGGAAFEKLVQLAKTSENSLSRTVRSHAMNLQESAAMIVANQDKIDKSILGYTRKSNKTLQNEYESALVQRLATNQGYNLKFFQDWVASGARLSGMEKRWYREQLALQKQSNAESLAQLAKYGRDMAVHMGLQAEKAREIAIAEAAAAQAAAAAKRAQAIENGVIAKARVTQEANYNAAVLAEMRQFYTTEAAMAEAAQAAKRAKAIENGVIAKARATQEATNNAAILAEMREFYTTEAAQAEVAQAAKRAQAVENGMIAKARLTQASTNNAAILAEMREFYKKQEVLANTARSNSIARAQAFAPSMGDAMKQAGPYMPYDPNTGARGGLAGAGVAEANAAMVAGKGHAAALSKGFKQLSVDGNDLHSVARGLASGFGLLWLTWGNLVPLFAGAAVSYGVKSVVSMGASVQQTFEVIRNLSEETTESVAALNKQMLELARSGPFGPEAIANSMKTLSLAGLNAKAVGVAIKDVMNFAVAGDTSLEKAADVMTSVAAAFGIAAEGYTYVGDVIAKTAAVSKASVESIGEAFKTSSVLGKQYGVALEDVGIGIAALANLGIQGSAAGTALRNMYVDLSERTPKVAKAMKQLTLEMRDSNGRFVDIVTMAKRFNTAMDEVQNNIDKKRFLQTILSERGGKPIIELTDLARQRMDALGGTVESQLDAMAEKIRESAGFMTIAAVEMSMTPLNQMKSVTASLQATIVETFQGMAPVITDTSKKLKDLFGSDEFKTALSNIVTLVGNLTAALVEHLGLITKVVLAYSGFKVLSWLRSGLTAVTAALAAKGAALTATAAAASLASTAVAATGTTAAVAAPSFLALAGGVTTLSGALGVAAVGFSRLLGFLNPILLGLTAVYAAYQTLMFFMDKSAKPSGTNQSTELSSRLQEETRRINENVEAMRLKMSVEDYRKQKELSASGDNTAKELASTLAPLQKELTALENNKLAIGATERNNKRIAALKDQIALQTELSRKSALQIEVDKENLRTAMRTEQEMVNAKISAARELGEAKTGKVAYGVAGPDRAEVAAKAAMDRMLKKQADYAEAEFNQIVKSADTKLGVLKHTYSVEQAMLDSKHKNGMLSEAEYQVESLAAIVNYEQKATATREQALKTATEQAEARAAQIDATMKSGSLQALLAEEAKLAAFTEKMNAEAAAQTENATLRMQKAYNDTTGSINKMSKELADFLRDDAIELEKASSRIGMSLDKYVIAEMEASANTTAKFAKQLGKLEDAATQARESIVLLQLSMPEGAEKEAALANARAGLRQLEGMINTTTARAAQSAAEAIVNAYNDIQEADLKQFSSAISGAIVDGLLGDKNTFEALRKSLTDYFIREPLQIAISGTISNVIGVGTLDKMKDAIWGTDSSPKNAGAKGLLDLASNAKSAFDWGSKLFGGSGAASAGGASIFAGLAGAGSAAGASGTLASLGAYGATSGVTTMGTSIYSIGTLGAGVGATVPVAGGVLGAGGLVASAPVVTGATTGALAGGSAAAAAPAFGIPGIGWAIGGALLLAGLLSAGNGRYVQSTGETSMWFDKEGKNTSKSDYRFPNANNASADAFASAMNKSYIDTAKALGIAISSSHFAFGGNDAESSTGKGKFRIGAGVEGRSGKYFNSGEIAYSEEEAKLATSRALLTVLSDSALPKYLAGLLDKVEDIAKLSQEQIDEVMKTAQAYTLLSKSLDELPMVGLRDRTYDVYNALVTAGGGMESFSKKLSDYYTNFYTQAEQADTTRANIAKTLVEAGVLAAGDALPATRDAFRALVDEASKAVDTEKGQKAFSALLDVSSAFAALTASAKDATSALEETNKALLDTASKAAKTALDNLSATVDAEKAALTLSYESQVSIFNTQLTAITNNVGKLQAFASTLKSTLDSLRIVGSEAQYRAAAQAQIRAAVITARSGGGLPLDGQLNQALSIVSQPSENLYSTFTDYARDFYRTANDISTLSELTGVQLTAEEAMQATLEAQLSLAKVNYEAQTKNLDDLVKNAKQQLELAEGSYKALLDLATAVRESTAATQALLAERLKQENAAKAGSTATTTVGPTVGPSVGPIVGGSEFAMVGDLTAGYNTVDLSPVMAEAEARMKSIRDYVNTLDFSAGGAEASTFLLAKTAKEYNVTQSEIAAATGYLGKDVQAMFARYNIPAFEIGTNYVPRDTLAMLHEGEAVVPRAYNPAAGGGLGEDSVVAELRAVRSELAYHRATLADIAASSNLTAKTLARVTENGDGMRIAEGTEIPVTVLT